MDSEFPATASNVQVRIFSGLEDVDVCVGRLGLSFSHDSGQILIKFRRGWDVGRENRKLWD